MTSKYEPTGFSETIFRQRYALSKDETWEGACTRVARHVAAAESNGSIEKWTDRFQEVLQNNLFIPGGRIWYGSGRAKGQLLNCFVCPAEDSREGWGKTVSDTLIISGTGGGVGINFTPIRPRGMSINGTGGESTGAVSLMEVIDQTGEVIKSGGGRRTALMMCLDYRHGDLREFLYKKFNKVDIPKGDSEALREAIRDTHPNMPIKEVSNIIEAIEKDETADDAIEVLIEPFLKHQKNQVLKNANISILVDQDFFDAVKNEEDIIMSWRHKEIDRIPARELWDILVRNAWESGEPGILNYGLANQMNNIHYYSPLVSTNPCGEIWLEPYGCCDLGAINLNTHLKDNDIDWDKLAETVTIGVRFLDNVLTVNHYPLPDIEQNCKKVRRIGLGVMGLGHALVKLGLRYDRSEGRNMVDRLFNFIKKRAYEASTYIAAEKGPFPVFDAEKFLQSGFCETLPKGVRAKIKEYGMRNCAVLTIAPTGTTSILAGTSSGIEPIFAPGYRRLFYAADNGSKRVLKEEIVVDPLFEDLHQSNANLDSLVSAHEVDVESHLRMQVVCQKHIDNAVSKTINLPNDYPVEKFTEILLKYAPLLKGTTIYREGSRGNEPLSPLTVEEAISFLDSSAESHKIGTAQNDCPSGICDIHTIPKIEITSNPADNLK